MIKEYCALYTDINDENYINDTKLFDTMFDLKSFIEKANFKNTNIELQQIFDYCFNQCKSRSFPKYNSEQISALKPHEQYPNLFVQCLLSSLSTIESFIYVTSSVHINSLLSMDYMPTKRLTSTFDVKTNEDQQLFTTKHTSNFYRNYTYANEHYTAIINPSMPYYVKCHFSSFSKYILENADAKSSALLMLKKIQAKLSGFVNQFNSFETDQEYCDLSILPNYFKLLQEYDKIYVGEYCKLSQQLPLLSQQLSSDFFLFIYKAMLFFQPELYLQAHHILSNNLVYDYHYIFSKIVKLENLCIYQPFCASLFSHYWPDTRVSSNQTDSFSMNEINELFDQFVPTLQKLFFILYTETNKMNISVEKETFVSSKEKIINFFSSEQNNNYSLIHKWQEYIIQFSIEQNNITYDFISTQANDALHFFTTYLSKESFSFTSHN